MSGALVHTQIAELERKLEELKIDFYNKQEFNRFEVLDLSKRIERVETKLFKPNKVEK